MQTNGSSRREFLGSALLGTAAAGLLNGTGAGAEAAYPKDQAHVNEKPYNPRPRPGTGAMPYDLRNGLTPRRLNIAMWDYSWLYGHHPGGPFEDFGRAVDELIERGFNCVRIDTFPMIIDHLEGKPDANWHVPANPHATWGLSLMSRDMKLVQAWLDFMRVTKEKGVYVILSSWGGNGQNYREREKFHGAWERTLTVLKENDLLSHVVYVDFDQEFPYFTPFQAKLNELGQSKSETLSLDGAMEAAGAGYARLGWNRAQMDYVKEYFESTCRYFQQRLPELRYTFSLTGYWNEVRAMKLWCLDVLEVHIWIHDPRFDERTGFNTMKKDRDPANDYKDYMRKLRATLEAMRPTLLQQMVNRMQMAHEWAQEMGTPLTTTEAWGPWWHMDHPDLEWNWLYDWCEECMALSENYQFWGVTPWNYAHPYWNNWSNKSWYRKVNHRFLNS